jgi:photosystem II stability/assembly factor-like uncharacterized protein
MATTLAVGTVKGLFLFGSQSGAAGFKLIGHHLEGWEVSSILMRPKNGTLDILTGTTHYAYGAVLRRSRDNGATWEQPAARPAYPEGSPYKTNRIWQLSTPPKNGSLYAGIDEAGLFESRDDGESWNEVTSLTSHPTRKGWMPGGGGLCLHTIVHDYSNPNRMWIAISAVGVFRTDDGGKSWTIRNNGLGAVATGTDEPSTAYCVHKVVQHPTRPNTLYMQFHGGVYVSFDGADTWEAREHGLPSNFGFPVAITNDGTLVLAPLHSDGRRYFPEGKAAVYRSTDEGKTWTASSKGLPDEPTFDGVLRDSMVSDGKQGVYMGTLSGNLFASGDAGESWSPIHVALPRVLCVRAIET